MFCEPPKVKYSLVSLVSLIQKIHKIHYFNIKFIFAHHTFNKWIIKQQLKKKK